MKKIEELYADLISGGRKYQFGLVLTNPDLKDMPLSDYIEYRSLINMTSEKTHLINPTLEPVKTFVSLDLTDLTPNERQAKIICDTLLETAGMINVKITDSELETVKSLLLESYFKEQPHTIKSLYMALEEIDQVKNSNVLKTLNAFI